MKVRTGFILLLVYMLCVFEHLSAWMMSFLLIFKGFGDPAWEYTATGDVVSFCVVYFFLVVAVAVFIGRIVRDYRKHTLKKIWWKESLILIIGSILGIWLFNLSSKMGQLSYLMRIIGQWMINSEMVVPPIM